MTKMPLSPNEFIHIAPKKRFTMNKYTAAEQCHCFKGYSAFYQNERYSLYEIFGYSLKENNITFNKFCEDLKKFTKNFNF